jgi:hypothetical protein
MIRAILRAVPTDGDHAPRAHWYAKDAHRPSKSAHSRLAECVKAEIHVAG